jgi:murein DD-endopeptidase MepM/ murein hydrolase activator NlpD
VNLVDPSGHGYCDSEYALAEECQGYLPNLLASLQNHGVFLEPLDSMTPGGFYFNTIDHPGQDYPNPTGSSIYAPAEGVVILVDNCSAPDCISQNRGDYDSSAPFNGGYGNVVVIEYPYGALPANLIAALGLEQGQSLFVLYAHLEDPSTFQHGDTVAPGQGIGSVGSTGFSTGPHLHYETRIGATGSLSYGYMCDSICYVDEGNHGAKLSIWYSPKNYSPVNPLDINYIPYNFYYDFGSYYAYK